MEWLSSKANDNQTRLQRIAELVAVNGGLQVRGYGFISFGGGPYGRQGLEMEEAHELMEYIGGIQMAFGADEFDGWIMPMLKAEWEKEKTSRDAPAPQEGDPTP
jgi:hypothetical protein